jgi:hypothetical protein
VWTRSRALPADLGHLQQRILDVLLGRQDRQQVEGLKDEADGSRTDLGEFVGRLAGDIPAIDDHLALAGRIDAPHDVQEGGLAAAGRSCDRHETALLHLQIDVLEREDILIAETIDLANVLDLNDHFFDSPTAPSFVIGIASPIYVICVQRITP